LPLVPPRALPGTFEMKTCIISVDPIPSTISVPNRAFHASNSGLGSDSPAETANRSDERSYRKLSSGYARSAA